MSGKEQEGLNTSALSSIPALTSWSILSSWAFEFIAPISVFLSNGFPTRNNSIRFWSRSIKLSAIDSKSIAGYETEEYTHLAVAASVFSEKATAGLGIQSAAEAMELDFVPLFTEQYDLVIPEEFYDGEIFQPILEVISSQKFKDDVEALGGYDTSIMGNEVVRIKT